MYNVHVFQSSALWRWLPWCQPSWFSRLKIAFKNLKASWQIFSSDLLSKFWKQIAGKFLKANRWKIFESFLKATRWKIFESFLKAQELAKFWKQIAGKFLKANRWKMFESKSLENFWKQIAGKFLKANRWQKFESFLNARPYCFVNGCGTPRTNSSAFARENRETY